MKQELMKMTSNDELQNKWKSCIQVTCHVFRTYEVLKDLIDKAVLAINHFLECIRNAFSDVSEKLSEVFKELKDFINKHEDFIEYTNSYPPSYPSYVDNLKMNTRGFPQPVMKCARSRC